MHVVMKAGSLTFDIAQLQKHLSIFCYREKSSQSKQPIWCALSL